jgi:MFS family permease
MTSEERRVIIASSTGTVFEWYDFYLAGALAANVNKAFFSGVNETAGFIFVLLGFAAGFAVRPFGALLFGRLGDIVGRKYTFLVTMLVMGASTFLIGVTPSYDAIGIAAPILFVACRLLQGLALGGEYGGAAIYVAEHAPHGRRGFYTSWVQTTASVGLLTSLVVILGLRMSMPPQAFDEYGWRLPFLISIVLLAVSIWIRLRLNESPAFRKMKAEGVASKSPLREAFGRWENIKISLIALFGATAGQAVVWYTGQFYALFFLTQTLKVDDTTASVLIALALLLGAPFFILFGWLSDRIGRKWIMMVGCILATISYFPLFHQLAETANPNLLKAHAAVKITVSADPDMCGAMFDPLGTRRFTQACDVARRALADNSLKYEHVNAPKGAPTIVTIGGVTTPVDDAFPVAALKAAEAAGYPEVGDASILKAQSLAAVFGDMRAMKALGVLFIVVLFVTMVYGPIAALLIELFPTRIRYSGMSLPYHVGNGWFGGFLAPVAFAIVAATGDIFAGIWYPVVVAALTFVIGMLFLPETKNRDIYAANM